nr:hypothetical protein [Tanacetum cinerariifolium]
SFDLVRIFDLPGHASVAHGGFCLFPLKDFLFVFVSNLLYSPLDVVEDALAQGVEGFGLMQNEDHQVLENEQKLEEDAPDCTRVDDDGVEFSLEGGDYFPTMGDETKKDKCSIFLLLLIQGAGLDELKHDLSTEESVAHKCKNAIVENEHEIMSLCDSNIEPNKADPEEVADLDPDQIPISASVALVSSIVPISILSHKTFSYTSVPNVSKVNKTNKRRVCVCRRYFGCSELMNIASMVHIFSGWVAPLWPHLVSAAHFLSFLEECAGRRLAPSDPRTVSSYCCARTGLMTSNLVCPSTYQLFWSSFGDSGPDMSFDMSTSPEHLSGSARARLATSTLRSFWNLHVKVSKEFLFPYLADQALFISPAERIGTPGPTDVANVEVYLRGPLGLGEWASNVRIIWFSFGSFGSVSFGSSDESKNVVQL